VDRGPLHWGGELEICELSEQLFEEDLHLETDQTSTWNDDEMTDFASGVGGRAHDLLGFGEPYQSDVHRLTNFGEKHRQLQVTGTWSRSAQPPVDCSDPEAKMPEGLHHLR
jgi:hypothetical protein